jgi:hypothetical protein
MDHHHLRGKETYMKPRYLQRGKEHPFLQKKDANNQQCLYDFWGFKKTMLRKQRERIMGQSPYQQ